MNFYSIIFSSFIIVSALLLFFVIRDAFKKGLFLNTHKTAAYPTIAILSIIFICSFDTRFIEPNIIIKNEFDFPTVNITSSLKIAFIADIQIGNHKKTAWTEKIVKKIEEIKPDLVLLGGDLIDNEGTFEDESQYLEPLRKISGQYPMYYILGNHEYGIGSQTQGDKNKQTGDRSALLIKKMNELNIALLRNSLACPEINHQKICLFGIDDIWSNKIDFNELAKWNTNLPLVFLTHNPDGIKLYPTEQTNPILTLAGHTHGGQLRLPFIGPLGNPEVKLPKKYFKGLNEYNGKKIFTTVGIGESGGPIRFWNPPEIAVINIKPQN